MAFILDSRSSDWPLAFRFSVQAQLANVRSDVSCAYSDRRYVYLSLSRLCGPNQALHPYAGLCQTHADPVIYSSLKSQLRETAHFVIDGPASLTYRTLLLTSVSPRACQIKHVRIVRACIPVNIYHHDHAAANSRFDPLVQHLAAQFAALYHSPVPTLELWKSTSRTTLRQNHSRNRRRVCRPSYRG